MDGKEELERIKQVYNTTYRHDPADRSYIWNPRNPVSIYFRQSQEKAIIALLNEQNIEIGQTLDVGCGNGSLLRFFVNLGAKPENLHGVDLMDYRIENARQLSPAGIDFRVGSAEALPYPDEFFDLISQFTVFSSILEPAMQKAVAAEMTRVLKPGGCLLWYDMRGGANMTTRGLEADEISTLFPEMKWLSLRKLHTPYVYRIAPKSILLCEILDELPFVRKTHYLILLQK